MTRLLCFKPSVFPAFIVLGLLCVWGARLSWAQTVQLRTFCNEDGVPRAEYTPGMDVHGDPVVPVDLNDHSKGMDYPIDIPIELSVLEWLGMDKSEGVDATSDVARVQLFEDGRVEYNGRDISDRVSHLCVGEQEQENPDNLKSVNKEGIEVEVLGQPNENTQQDSGQEADDPLPSAADQETETNSEPTQDE